MLKCTRLTLQKSIFVKMPLRLPKCHHGPTNTFILSSPVGDLELIACPHAVHSLSILTDEASFKPNLGVPVRITSQEYNDNGYTYKSATLSQEWLQKYFDGSNSELLKQLPLVCHLVNPATTFREQVWATLAEKVSFGETVSYSQLAKLCNRSQGSSQAVGQAMRTNPVGIIVPCHRVILSSGSLGNYGGGSWNTIKKWLLQHEGLTV